MASVTWSGDSVGPKGALGKAFELPFGDAIVYALAAGLVCFAGWRAVQGIYDPDRFTCGPSSLARRVFVYGGSSLLHLGLAAIAIISRRPRVLATRTAKLVIGLLGC